MTSEADSIKLIDWDVFAHPVWQQASLVPETSMTVEEIAHLAELEEEAAPVDMELETVAEWVDHCFNAVSNKSVGDSIAKLKAMQKTSDPAAAAWSKWVLETAFPSLSDAEVMQVWYDLTDMASRSSYEQVLLAEYHANMNVVHKQLYETPIEFAHVLNKLPASSDSSVQSKMLQL